MFSYVTESDLGATDFTWETDALFHSVPLRNNRFVIPVALESFRPLKTFNDSFLNTAAVKTEAEHFEATNVIPGCPRRLRDIYS